MLKALGVELCQNACGHNACGHKYIYLYKYINIYIYIYLHGLGTLMQIEPFEHSLDSWMPAVIHVNYAHPHFWFFGIWKLCVFLEPMFYFHIYYTRSTRENLSTSWIIRHKYTGKPKCYSGHKISNEVTRMSYCITTIIGILWLTVLLQPTIFFQMYTYRIISYVLYAYCVCYLCVSDFIFYTAQKMNFSKSLMENFIFCAVILLSFYINS